MKQVDSAGLCQAIIFLKKLGQWDPWPPSPQTKISRVLVSKNTFKDVFDNTCDIGDFCTVKIAERFAFANEQRKGYFG